MPRLCLKLASARTDDKSVPAMDLRSKMILEVINHFFVDKSTRSTVFSDHDPEENDMNDDHRVKLITHMAEKYFTLRLFTYGKRHCESVLQGGKPSNRHTLMKRILFSGQ